MTWWQTLSRPLLRTYVRQQARKNLPNYNQSKILQGLEQPVEIIRDRWAVPHIYAQSEADVFRAQAYVHAQDRLWQMEVFRRASLGTLSEVFGREGLPSDQLSRSMGIGRRAAMDAKQSPLLEGVIQPYVEGVNAFLASKKPLPAAFKLLGIKPRPWTAQDVFAIGRFLALQMSQGWLHEIERWKLVQQYGLERTQDLFPAYPKTNPCPLEDGNVTQQRLGEVLKAFQGPYWRPAHGSNSWAVAPNRTTTGTAMLCNDPHLIIDAPNIWYENHLVAEDGYEATGISIAGAPMVLIGHNAHMAWGITLSYADVQDLYVESFSPTAPNEYLVDGTWKTATLHTEHIAIKGKAKPLEWMVKETHHGPIIAELDGGQQLALSTRALQEHRMFEGFYGLNKAQHWNDFVAACAQMDAPSLNIVYADVEHNIGYYMAGQVPVRVGTDALLPRDGSNSQYDWQGMVPFEEMPHAFNPSQGYFYTCNNKIVTDDFPHDLGHIWMNGYRAARLKTLLDTKERHSPADFKQWQLDVHCLPGLAFAQWMASCQTLPNYQSLPAPTQALGAELVQWDGNLTAESRGGAIYQQLKVELGRLVFAESHDVMRGRLTHPSVELFLLSEFFGYDTATLLRLREQPDSSWWQQTPDETLLQALVATEERLKERLGKDRRQWTWGALHPFIAKHVLGQSPWLKGIWDVGPYPIGGDTDTLCQLAAIPGQEDGNHSMIGPSFRQVLDLGDWDQGWCMAPLGQSGNLCSKHYQDQFSDWQKGRYKPMLWSRTKVKSHQKYHSWLKPKPSGKKG